MDRHSMFDPPSDELLRAVRSGAFELGDARDLDPLVERIGSARVVLLGEATHGTSEFYTWRARLSQRLIAEEGFDFIAVEGDWPACSEVHRFIGHDPAMPAEAVDVLGTFRRWPTWMWANWEVVALAEWLREHNRDRGPGERAGFFGLDVYSLWESLEAVMQFLDARGDARAVAKAREAVMCFEPYGGDEHAYARANAIVGESCEDEVVELLETLRERAGAFVESDSERFDLLQNARVLVNADHYYRTMVRGGPHAWNVRDYHMADTLDALLAHHGPASRAIVWEHNTHIGDARATTMAGSGMVNLGQLARERFGDEDVVLVGFGSYEGSVIAGASWGAPMRELPVPPATPSSWEEVFARAVARDVVLLCDELAHLEEAHRPRGHRAIGVVYDPAFERYGNYVPTVLPRRYDAFVYLHHTHALHPLHLRPTRAEIPETFPFGV